MNLNKIPLAKDIFYLPDRTTTTSTEKKGNKAMIIIKDNGLGRWPTNIDKIFQPFLTTKPTCEATGPGLSFSYDITKARQAELKVDSKENEYETFTMELNY